LVIRHETKGTMESLLTFIEESFKMNTSQMLKNQKVVDKCKMMVQMY
jgi:hypothetical protein